MSKLMEFLGTLLIVVGIAGSAGFGTYVMREDFEYLLGDHKPPVVLEVPVPVEVMVEVPVVEEYDMTDYYAILTDGTLQHMASLDEKVENVAWVIELQFNWGDGILLLEYYFDLGGEKLKGYGFQITGVSKYKTTIHDRRTPDEGF
jgi:hypothetical protein